MAQLERQSVVSVLLFPSRIDAKPYKILLFRRSENVGTYQKKLAPVAGSIEQSDKQLIDVAWRTLKDEAGLDQRYIRFWRRGAEFEFNDDEETVGEQGRRTLKVWPFAFQFKKDPVDENSELEASILKINGDYSGCEWVSVDDIFGGKIQHECVPGLDVTLGRVWADPQSELYQGLEGLRYDTASKPEDLATDAVRVLVKIIESCQRDNESMSSDKIAGWWRDFKLQAFQLARSGRPSTGDITSSAVVLALKDARDKVSADTANVLEDVKQSLQQSIRKRQQIPAQVNKHLSTLLQEQLQNLSQNNQESSKAITILALSESSAIQVAILHALDSDPSCRIELHIPESHKLYEGTSIAQSLTEEAQERKKNTEGGSGTLERLSVVVSSNASTSILNPGVDIVIVNADRISEAGDVGIWSTSLATILASKQVTEDSVRVICIGETEKIAPFGSTDEHRQAQDDDNNQLQRISSAKSIVSVRRVETEWVPSRYIDFYVCEEGTWSVDDITARSKQIIDMTAEVFDGLQDP